MVALLGVAAGLVAAPSPAVATPISGGLVMWGLNDDEQLGDGTDHDRLTPGPVPGLSDVTQISAGDLATLALRADGAVWGWGFNLFEQLGDFEGEHIVERRPIQVLPPGSARPSSPAASAWRSRRRDAAGLHDHDPELPAPDSDRQRPGLHHPSGAR
jgi:hypothetical protein